MRTVYTLAATAAALIVAMAPAQAAPPILSEGFEDLGTLGGWSFVNQSSPAGLSWFQGNPGVFAAQAGPDDSYAAANFLSAGGGSGSIDNWMITPQLTLPGMATITFYARSAGTPGFSDQLEVRYSNGGSAVGDFSNLLLAVGGPYPSGWQQYTINADLGATARLAFRYTGSGATADYIGIDTLTVAAVPEPAEWMMLAGGLALLAWRGRRAVSKRTRLIACLPLLLAANGAMAAGQEGMVMVRDAETGAMRPATAAEFTALRAQRVQTPVVPPQVAHRPDGTRQSRVSTRAVYAVATRGADGKMSSTCVHGADAAQAATQQGDRHEHH